MTTVARGHEVRGDSLWLAGDPPDRSAGSGWSFLASWIDVARGSSTRRAARLLVRAHASVRATMVEATREIHARLEAIDADRPPSSLPLPYLGLAVAAGIHGFGLVALRLSGRTVSIILMEGVLLTVSGLAAAVACVGAVARERTLAARRQREEDELVEIAASFDSSDWRRRIGGS